MNTKTYKLDGVEFGFRRANRKWGFNCANGHSFLIPCGGLETAQAVAKQLVGGMKRTGGAGIDNMARGQVKKLLA